MRLDYLKTFLTVAKKRNFSVAAKELGLTQGAVSHHIAALEEFFGAELFKRAASGVEVTRAGAILEEAAERILTEVEKVRIQISVAMGTLGGTIRIAASTIPGEHLLPSLVAAFQENHSDVKFKIKAEDSINSLMELQAGNVDFAAVGTLEGFEEKLEAIAIGEEELVLIVPNRHELSSKKSVKPSEVLKYQYVNREETSGTRKEIERMLASAGVSPAKLRSTLELASTESVVTAVSEGRGVSIISSLASKRAQAAGLVKVLHLQKVNSTRKLYMVRQKRPLIKTSEAFWDFCKNWVSQKLARS